ncbi:MAG: hydrogenase-4 component G [Desulfobacterium sp.]|jgi:hypothetical protein|nr:hydrogenase-4 component G [Desulfobacterium sp.]
MKISDSSSTFQKQEFTLKRQDKTSVINTYTEKASDKITVQFLFESMRTTTLNLTTQTKLAGFGGLGFKEEKPFTNELPFLSNLTQESARELIGEDGYYGVAKTSKRIAEFVLNGAGDDLERLNQGRKGILAGFKDAEKAWGGKLPDISYATIEEAVKSIDAKISELGGNLVDVLS